MSGDGAGVVMRCPICDWTCFSPEPEIGAGALAGVFGYGVMAAVSRAERLQENERTLAAHFHSHPIVDWVRAVVRRQAVVDAAKWTVRDLHYKAPELLGEPHFVEQRLEKLRDAIAELEAP